MFLRQPEEQLSSLDDEFWHQEIAELMSFLIPLPKAIGHFHRTLLISSHFRSSECSYVIFCFFQILRN